MSLAKPSSFEDLSELSGFDPNNSFALYNYVCGDARQLCANPAKDLLAHQMPLTYSGSADSRIVSYQTLPGHLDYLRKIGLLKGEVIEIKLLQTRDLIRRRLTGAFTTPQDLNNSLGYPNGSIEHELLRCIETDKTLYNKLKGHRPVTTFENIDSRNLRSILGTTELANVDKDLGAIANSKSELRRASAKYGFKMTEGIITKNPEELKLQVLEYLNRGIKKVWLKTASGVAGKLVRPVESPDILNETVAELLNEIDSSLALNHDQENSDFKTDFVAEIDIADHLSQSLISLSEKPLTINFNAQAVISDHQITPIGFSEQKTDSNGKYLGNEFDDSSKTNAMGPALYTELIKVCKWLQDLGYRGVMGADLIATIQGEKQEIFVIDCNARFNGSTSSILIKNHFGAKNVTNMIIEAPKSITDFNQATQLLGQNLLFSPEHGRGILPKRFNSLVLGRYVIPANTLVADLVSNSKDESEDLISRMRARSLKIIE